MSSMSLQTESFRYNTTIIGMTTAPCLTIHLDVCALHQHSLVPFWRLGCHATRASGMHCAPFEPWWAPNVNYSRANLDEFHSAYRHKRHSIFVTTLYLTFKSDLFSILYFFKISNVPHVIVNVISLLATEFSIRSILSCVQMAGHCDDSFPVFDLAHFIFNSTLNNYLLPST